MSQSMEYLEEIDGAKAFCIIENFFEINFSNREFFQVSKDLVIFQSDMNTFILFTFFAIVIT